MSIQNLFRDADEREDARVVVVNRTMAQETWPGRSALGQTLELDGATYEVIGVVGDIGSGFTLGRRLRCVYRPDVPSGYASPSAQGVTLLVRAERSADVPLLVRRELDTILPDLTVFNVSSMTEQVERMASIFRMATAIYGGMGLFGLVLAAVGLGGVSAYAVARRTHEIGIRRAPGSVRPMVGREPRVPPQRGVGLPDGGEHHLDRGAPAHALVEVVPGGELVQVADARGAPPAVPALRAEQAVEPLRQPMQRPYVWQARHPKPPRAGRVAPIPRPAAARA